MRRRVSHQGIEKGIAGEQIGTQTQSFHLVENRGGKVGLAGMHIGTNRGVQKGFGRPGQDTFRVEYESVEMVLGVGGYEGDEEGLGV